MTSHRPSGFHAGFNLRRVMRALPVAVLCALGVALPSANAQTSNEALLASSVPKVQGACPAYVVVASRGNDQNEPEDLRDGFEGPNIRGMLTQLEQRHGVSAPVIALPPELYPAKIETPDLIGRGENVMAEVLMRRVASTLSANSSSQIVDTSRTSLGESVQLGVNNTEKAIEYFELTTGCKPKYLLVGYSQGALVSTPLETWLAARGQLAGVANIGDPLQPITGVLDQAPKQVQAWLPIPWAQSVNTVPRASLCVRNDFMCWPTMETPVHSGDGNAGVHGKYFLDKPPSPGQREAEAAYLAEVAAMLRA